MRFEDIVGDLIIRSGCGEWVREEDLSRARYVPFRKSICGE